MSTVFYSFHYPPTGIIRCNKSEKEITITYYNILMHCDNTMQLGSIVIFLLVLLVSPRLISIDPN